MRINCHIVVRAKENRIEKQQGLFDSIHQLSYGEFYKIYVSAPPEDGKANKKVIELLADYFKAAKSQIKIIKGETSRNKIIEIKGI